LAKYQFRRVSYLLENHYVNTHKFFFACFIVEDQKSREESSVADKNRSKLVRMTVRNIGCIGNEGLSIELDNVVCLVGKNNSGKSTILRAYELAKGSAPFIPSKDRCLHAKKDEPSEVTLEIHIPEGIGNVDAAWKSKQGDFLIVKSRWQWLAPEYQIERKTWDPAGGDWAVDKKAGGADPVFSSRLPRPIRIGSLDDAAKTEEILLTLALTPLISTLEELRKNSASDLAVAISDVTAQINKLSGEHSAHFSAIASKVTTGFQSVFPNLNVLLDIASAPLIPKIPDLVKGGSGLRIVDGRTTTKLEQQGTGARRALFWAMLQVHNEMTREKDLREDYRKKTVKWLDDEQRKLTAKKITEEEVVAIKFKMEELKALLGAHDAGAPIPQSSDDPALPGYLLLIDEPENALHPMAARAAQRHLYKLAESADWQVMMTTHSPYFINPFEDHTTIVRLERTLPVVEDEIQKGGDSIDPLNLIVELHSEGEQEKKNEMPAHIEPRTYRSDLVKFQGDEKQRLQALQHIDPSFAEIFFGSYPILVEGDTEHAVFVATIIEKEHELIDKVTIIRARGKAILAPLIRLMQHFKIPFSIVHDCDPPFKKNGENNGMWTENEKIRQAIIAARGAGLEVRHRVSFPDFERFLGRGEESKDKPLNAYRAVTEDEKLGAQVQAFLKELLESPQHEPYSEAQIKNSEEYANWLKTKILEWAALNGSSDKTRFNGIVVPSPKKV
jgi:putative ATP-dependent endonuclease of OLD family